MSADAVSGGSASCPGCTLPPDVCAREHGPITVDDLGDAHGHGQEKAIGWLVEAVRLAPSDSSARDMEQVIGRMHTIAYFDGCRDRRLVRAHCDGIGSALCDVARGVVGGSLARFLRREDLAGQPHPSSWPSEIVNPAGLSTKILEAAVVGAAGRLLNHEGRRIEEPMLIEVRLIGAELPSQERWGHAEQEEPEHFTGAFLTREEAIDDGCSTYEGPFYVIKGRAPRAADFVYKGVALKREQGTSRFVLGPAIGKTEVRYADGIKRALDVLCPHLERLTSLPSADQIVAVLDDAADRWSTSIERADTPDRDRPHAKKLFQARAVLALLGAASSQPPGQSAADFARDLQAALAETDDALRLAIDSAKGSQKPRFIGAHDAVKRLRGILAAGCHFTMRSTEAATPPSTPDPEAQPLTPAERVVVAAMLWAGRGLSNTALVEQLVEERFWRLDPQAEPAPAGADLLALARAEVAS